jgi:feruloyl-CoA synthase
MEEAPISTLSFAPAQVEVHPQRDGSTILRSPRPIRPHVNNLAKVLRRWADTTPERIFLAEKAPSGGWNALTYAEVARRANAVSQALLDLGLKGQLGEDSSTILILSDNGLANALLQLGAMQIGVISVPISPAYSLISRNYSKLKFMFDQVSPTVIYARDGKQFEKALSVLDLKGVRVIVSANPPASIEATLFSELLAAKPTDAVDASVAKLTPDTIVKILFTSGSTGWPKGVVNTQGMLCANQESLRQTWPFLEEKPPLILDWLPWNHTFGANHNFNMMLVNGGALYIDNGKPMPGLIEHTVSNLKQISPTIYFNVPRGYDVLLPYLEQDSEARDGLFRNLDMIFYAAAALPQHLWERLETLSVQSRGKRVVMASGWGCTESSPIATLVHFPIDRAGVIGLPVPGVELKLVTAEGRTEMRIRGPNIMPGYWKDKETTQNAFDEEGFLYTGDVGKLVDPNDPSKGIAFDGRIAENFKLMSGTWVKVGEVRASIVEMCAPIVQDAVVTGHDRDELGLLIFPNIKGCQSLCSDGDAQLEVDKLIKRPEIRAALLDRLCAYNQLYPGNSTRIAHALLMSEPADSDANEINDKGYINQRAVLDRRAELVEKLYAARPDDEQVITVGK